MATIHPISNDIIFLFQPESSNLSGFKKVKIKMKRGKLGVRWPWRPHVAAAKTPVGYVHIPTFLECLNVVSVVYTGSSDHRERVW